MCFYIFAGCGVCVICHILGAPGFWGGRCGMYSCMFVDLDLLL